MLQTVAVVTATGAITVYTNAGQLVKGPRLEGDVIGYFHNLNYIRPPIQQLFILSLHKQIFC